MNGVAEQSCLVKWFFNKAFQSQSELVRQGRPVDSGYDKKVFAKLRAKMGLENVRVLVTGAAPIAPYLAEFLKVVTGGKAVLEGYGMTEASAATSIGMVGDRNLGHTGPPVSCAEVRLEDIPGGWTHFLISLFPFSCNLGSSPLKFVDYPERSLVCSRTV
jgi:long-chain acyl-CoA synthetase